MLKKYTPFLRAGAIDTMAFRFNILIWAGITVCEVACMIFLWLSVYRSSEGGVDTVIHGFSYREMISYVVLTTIFGFVTYNNDTLWNINTDIKKGTVGNYLIKPISYRGKFAATSLGNLLTMTLMFGLPFLIFSGSMLIRSFSAFSASSAKIFDGGFGLPFLSVSIQWGW